ncbi:rhodanese-like domain-containing protein [Streptomyces sp. SPB074]|uniref:rhodanese-like domain-containing protein n=1 Tax=Streptomyces sp. (strain SPB074) TaxID=465543 RepID=UPI00017F2406|nr:rhodanese-like domain-containing protein [Streptomyces sp. SPB074]EDY43491.1 rhodanese family protein [Streptomyces sp. SPB074]
MSIHLSPAEARARLRELTVIDVRSPGEFAAGHLPGAYNVPLDQLDRAVPVLRETTTGEDLLLVCAAGPRAEAAHSRLAERGVAASVLDGGTNAWTEERGELELSAGGGRTPWDMNRQVRFTAGALVLLGLLAGRRAPKARLLAVGIAGGLVYSGVSGSCGMAAALGKLPFNRQDDGALDATIEALRTR